MKFRQLEWEHCDVPPDGYHEAWSSVGCFQIRNYWIGMNTRHFKLHLTRVEFDIRETLEEAKEVCQKLFEEKIKWGIVE